MQEAAFQTMQAADKRIDEVDRAIAALEDSDRPILVDFDHTLFSSNSTELFLSSARPAFVVSCLLGLVRGAVPWHLYSSRHHRPRDYLTVLAVVILMPWTLMHWRRRGPELLRRYTRHAVAEALRHVPADRLIIVSFGFSVLIRPLLRGSPWESCRLVSMRIPCNPKYLRAGKASLIQGVLSPTDLSKAVFITDSEHDRDLLDAVGNPFLIPMQGTRVLADTRLYLPWRYASLGKYGRNWVVDQTLRVDFILTLLGTRALWYSSAWMVAGVVLLFISLHAVYEIGYFENDFAAASTEANPTLAEGVEMFRGFPLARHAWAWGIVLGSLGCFAIAEPLGVPPSGLLVTWGALLIATRLLFHCYNRRPTAQRLLLYPFLQAAKTFGILAVVPGFVLGTMLLASQVMLMWIVYAVYRQAGRKGTVPREEVRLAAFLTLAAGAVLAGPATLTEAGPLAIMAMLGWAIWRVVFYRLDVSKHMAQEPHRISAGKADRA